MIVGEGDYTEIVHGKDVKKRLLEGANKIKIAVGTTFGPYGSNVAICKSYNLPHVTKDGVTVAKDLKLKDPVEDVALQIIKESAKQTARIAGDGTTSTTLLAAHIVDKGTNSLGGISIRDIQNSMAVITKGVEDNITKAAKPVETEEDIYNVAFVASNGDTTITHMITEAFTTQDTNKVIVRDSDTGVTKITVVDGIRMDATSMVELQEKVTLEDARVMVTDHDITGVGGAGKVLQLYAEIKEQPLVVFANDIDKEAAQVMNYAISQGAKLALVRAPHIADARKEYLRLLSVALSATFIDSKEGWEFNETSVAHLGVAATVIVDYQETVVLGRTSSDNLDKEIRIVQAKIDSNKDGLASLYTEYMGILKGKSAVLEVGGNNGVEVREFKDRVDDTVRAVEASISTGVVKGALLAYDTTNISGEFEPIVLKIVQSAIDAMRDRLLYNNNGEEVWNESVVDPALVAIQVFKNALSAASLILTTDCVIVKRKQEE